MNPDTILTNFNVSQDIRDRFDDVCRLAGKTRTKVLVELMDGYIMSMGPELAKRYPAIASFDQSLSIRSRSNGDRRESNDPPDIWVSTGREVW